MKVLFGRPTLYVIPKDKADKEPDHNNKIWIFFSFTWNDLSAFHESDKIL